MAKRLNEVVMVLYVSGCYLRRVVSVSALAVAIIKLLKGSSRGHPAHRLTDSLPTVQFVALFYGVEPKHAGAVDSILWFVIHGEERYPSSIAAPMHSKVTMPRSVRAVSISE